MAKQAGMKAVRGKAKSGVHQGRDGVSSKLERDRDEILRLAWGAEKYIDESIKAIHAVLAHKVHPDLRHDLIIAKRILKDKEWKLGGLRLSEIIRSIRGKLPDLQDAVRLLPVEYSQVAGPAEAYSGDPTGRMGMGDGGPLDARLRRTHDVYRMIRETATAKKPVAFQQIIASPKLSARQARRALDELLSTGAIHSPSRDRFAPT